MDLLKQLLGLGDNVKNFVGGAIHNVENSIGQGVQNVENFAQPAVHNVQQFVQNIPQDFSHIQVPHIQVPQIQVPKIDVGSYLNNNVVKPVENALPNIQTFLANSMPKQPTMTPQTNLQDLFKPVQQAIAPYEVQAGNFLNNFKLSDYTPKMPVPDANAPLWQKGVVALLGLTQPQQDFSKALSDFVVSGVTQPVGQLLQAAGTRGIGQGTIGQKLGDALNLVAIAPIGHLTELLPKIEPAVKLLQNKLRPEDVRLLGTFAEMVDQNPKQNFGQVGQDVQHLAENVFGPDAANWTNTKLKNVFDVVLQKIGTKPNQAGLGLAVGDIRQGASNIAQGAQDFLTANPTINTPEIIQAAQDLAKADGRPQVAVIDLQNAAKNLGKDILTAQPATTEIAKVADNLQKNNPGLGRTEAEAMAQDVIKNRPFSNSATSANPLEQGTNAVAAQVNPAEPVAQALPGEVQTAPLPNEQQTSSLPQDTRKILTGQATKDKTLVSRMQQSDKFAPELQQALNGTYIPQSNADTISVAKKLVATDPVAAETRAMNPQNAVDQAIGAELFSHYMSAGNVSKANEILNATSGTNEGQMIQILSQYDKTSPTGAVKFAQSQVDAYNKLHPEKPLSITNDQVQAIFNKATEIQKMPMGRERNIAANELMNQVNALIPSSFTDKLVTIWKAGLLTSLRTHERNLVGNTIHQAAEIAKDPFASVADMIMASKTGKRTITPTINGLISGAKQGAQAAADIITKGYDPQQAISKFDVKQINWGNSVVGKAFKAYTETVFRTLGAEDKPFWNAAYARSLYDQAGAAAINAGKAGDQAFIENLVKNPTEKMLGIATTDANTATFHGTNQLSKLGGAIQKIKIAGIPVGQIVAPFTGVPSAIAQQIVAYSPVGLLNGIKNAGKVMISSNEIPNLQRQAAQEIGRGVIGSGLVAIGAYLASKGLMTGQPKDANEAAQWKLEGKTPNSVLIGGQWRSIGSIGPENLVLLAGAKAQEELAKGKDASPTSYVANLGKDFLGQTFLQGVQGPLNALNDPGRYGQNIANSEVTSTIPNIVKDVAKSGDQFQRESKTAGIVPNLVNSVKAGIPGARETLQPQRDALGNPIPNDQQGINAFIDLFNSSTPRSSVVINELSRLNNVGNNATPSKMTANQTILGQKVKLTPEQLNQMQGGMAQELQNNLQTLITGPNYQSLTDEEKANAINQVVQKTRTDYKNTPGAVSTANGATSPTNPTSGSVTGVAQNVADYAKAYKFDQYLQPNTNTGIAKYKFEADKAKTARDIFNGSGSYSNIPDNIKEQIYTGMGYTKDQVQYDATASEPATLKSKFILDSLGQAQNHNEVLQVLESGRKQSISGSQLVTDSVITDAKNAGYITATEEKLLKSISVDQNGNVQQKAGSTGTTGKQNAEITALGKGIATPPKLSSFVAASKAAVPQYAKVPQFNVAIPQRPNITFPTVATVINNSKSLAPQVKVSGTVQRGASRTSAQTTPVKLSQSFFRPRKVA